MYFIFYHKASPSVKEIIWSLDLHELHSFSFASITLPPSSVPAICPATSPPSSTIPANWSQRWSIHFILEWNQCNSSTPPEALPWPHKTLVVLSLPSDTSTRVICSYTPCYYHASSPCLFQMSLVRVVIQPASCRDASDRCPPYQHYLVAYECSFFSLHWHFHRHSLSKLVFLEDF